MQKDDDKAEMKRMIARNRGALLKKLNLRFPGINSERFPPADPAKLVTRDEARRLSRQFSAFEAL